MSSEKDKEFLVENNPQENIKKYKEELIETLKRLDETYKKVESFEDTYTKFSRSYWEIRLAYLKERRELLEKLAKIDIEYHKVFEAGDEDKTKDLVSALKS